MKAHNYLIISWLLLFFTSFTITADAIDEANMESAPNCSIATSIYCGTPLWVQAAFRNDSNTSDYDLSGCFVPTVSYDGNDYLFRVDAGVIPTTLSITMTNNTTDMDVLVFRNCGAVFTGCVGYSNNVGNGGESVIISDATGSYYIVVDGPNSYNNSGFMLSVDCNSSPPPPPPPPYGSNCYGGTNINCGDNLYVPYGGNNSFGQSNYDISNCTHASYSYAGYDHVFQFDVGSSPRNISITMTGLHADLDMFLFKTCTNVGYTRFSNCQGYSTEYGYSSEQIDLSNATGSYILVVDGFASGVNSSFNLSLNCTTYSPANCYDAYPLHCGDQKWVYAPTHNSYEGSDYDLSGCLGYGNAYQGNDHLYRIDAGYAGNQQLVIKMTGLSSDLDLLLFKSCGSHYGSTQLSQCVGVSRNYGSTSEEIIIDNAQGVYYLSVDGSDPWYNSGYEISLECHTYTPNICHYATPLWCGESTWVSAPTANHLDSRHYNYNGCFAYGYGFSGYDHLYEIQSGGYGQTLKISMSGLTADMDLLLYQYCNSGYGQTSLSHCVDYSINSGNSNEEIIVPNASGTYYLVVDSEDPWYNSGYEISVHCYAPVQNICHYATPLYCGDNKWVNAATSNHLDSRHYDYAGCFGYSYGFTGYDHLYEIDAGYGGKDITIQVSNLSADLDLLLYKSCGDHYGSYKLTDCVDYSLKGGTSSEEIHIYNASGTYYLAVDANDPWDQSGYEISMYCNQQSSFDCNDAIWLSCGETHWSDAPNVNHLSGDDYLFSECGGSYYSYEGYDHLYEVNVGYQDQHLEIDLTNLSADLDLLVFSSCSPSYSNARVGGCQDYSASSGYSSEHVSIHNASGTYYIVVDAKSVWDYSSYEIKVTCTPYGTYGGGGDDPADDDPADDDPADDDPADDNSSTSLACGVYINGSTIGQTSNFDNDDISQCFQTNLVYTGPDQLISFEKINDDDILELILIQDDANLSLFVLDEAQNFVDVSCRGYNYSSNKIAENNNVVGEVYSDDGLLPAGNYYALVEGYNRTIESDFVLSLACGSTCIPDETLTCESSSTGASNVDAGNGQNIYTGPDDVSFVGYTGGEWSATLSVDSSSEITINLYNFAGQGDVDMFLQDSCGSGSFIHSSTNSDTTTEQIIVTLDAGDYHLVVDGWHGGAGTFDIEVTGCADVTAAATESAVNRSIPNQDVAGQVESLDIMPNPFTNHTDLVLNVTEDTDGTLQLYAIDGRLIYRQNLQLTAGNKRLRLDENTLGDTYGIIVYRFVTQRESFQGSILRMK